MRSKIRSRFVFLLLLIIGGGVLLGYWMGGSAPWRTAQVPSSPVGTTGVIDSEKARERGAELGQQAAAAAGTRVTRIGFIADGTHGLSVCDGSGRAMAFTNTGWDHFRG